MAAISSYNIVLKTSDTAAGTYAELVPVKDFPDLGSAPDTIEVTTLRDKMKRYIQGLQDTGSFEFTYNQGQLYKSCGSGRQLYPLL